MLMVMMTEGVSDLTLTKLKTESRISSIKTTTKQVKGKTSFFAAAARSPSVPIKNSNDFPRTNILFSKNAHQQCNKKEKDKKSKYKRAQAFSLPCKREGGGGGGGEGEVW